MFESVSRIGNGYVGWGSRWGDGGRGKGYGGDGESQAESSAGCWARHSGPPALVLAAARSLCCC